MLSMQSSRFWVAVGAAADMFEAEPVEGTFDDWLARTWPYYEKMCLQLAKHHYVMRTAYASWCARGQPEIDEATEREHLRTLGVQVGLEPNEFIDAAWTRHKHQCLNALSD